ncbi:MAG TPA: RIP metalloprotease RseP [Chitinophagaceae bacterium]|nr:RIP metalloprotease RseP [Chitinophagaceae bacterium]
MTLLAINWPQVGLQAGYLIFSLSILVILHELGHFLTAKWFKCRVEKFYLFFDPWFSLVKKKIGETVYGIGWLPLGGYVKIAGMIDESMDKEQMKQPPQPWEFRSKPAWQRLIIMLAGVTMNILFAFFLYAMILYKWGDTKLPMANVKNGIWITDSIMYNVGLRNGDHILSVDNKPVKYFDDASLDIILGDTIKVLRNGGELTLVKPVQLIGQLSEKKGKRSLLLSPRMPVIVGSLDEKNSKNLVRAGIKVMDQIIAIDSTPVPYFDQVAPVISKKKNDSVTLSIKRNDQIFTTRTVIDSSGKLGFYLINLDQADSLGLLKEETKKYGFFESFPAGIVKAGDKLNSYIQQFKQILNPQTGAYKGLGGFKTMASIFPDNGWDWEAFWNITAFFSIILAFMNLLPIPALDGGHVLFTLYEMISGRRPSDKFLEYAQIAGMVILFALMLYANGNDWFGWGKGR